MNEIPFEIGKQCCAFYWMCIPREVFHASKISLVSWNLKVPFFGKGSDSSQAPEKSSHHRGHLDFISYEQMNSPC